jgi:hypothetical protein
MYSQGVTELGRWVVRGSAGEVVKRFNTQTQAIDFANRAQKAEKIIVLIDVHRTEIQLIQHAVREEIAS